MTSTLIIDFLLTDHIDRNRRLGWKVRCENLEPIGPNLKKLSPKNRASRGLKSIVGALNFTVPGYMQARISQDLAQGGSPPKDPKWPAPPPKNTVDRCDFLTALDDFFLQIWVLPQVTVVARYGIFCFRLFEVQNFKILFGIPKPSRNWMRMFTHPGSV